MSEYTNLTSLSIDQCAMHELNCSLLQARLERFSITSNKSLRNIRLPERLASLKALELDSNGGLQMLDMRNCNLNSLTTLAITNNGLRNVMLPRELPLLRVLNASRNRLEQMDLSISVLPSLI